MKFDAFGLDDKLMEAIDYMGFGEATPVQEKAIPVIQAGGDLIACAQTGTGKTAAFVLPILHKISREEQAGIKALIIVPTRELAVQIDKQIEGLSYYLPVASVPVYGGGSGSDWEAQKQALSRGVDIVVATPGKLIAHLNMGYLKFNMLNHLILDEADKMLDMGFFEDIMKIISFLPENRQTLMFSATMPPKIRKLAKQILKNPVEINIALSKPSSGVRQGAYLVYENKKNELINDLIDDRREYNSILVFSSTKRKVAEIVKTIRKSDLSALGITSDLEQTEREEVLRKFRGKQIKILVATDLLSRGIDIKDIDLIVNFDVPHEAEDYIHRVGRTARAESTGEAITFISEHDIRKFQQIERLIGYEVRKLPLPNRLGKSPEYSRNSKQSAGRTDFRKKRKKPRRN